MKIEVLSRAKKKKFVEGLSELGITKIPQMLVRSGKERTKSVRYAVSGECLSSLRCEKGFARVGGFFMEVVNED